MDDTTGSIKAQVALFAFPFVQQKTRYLQFPCDLSTALVALFSIYLMRLVS